MFPMTRTSAELLLLAALVAAAWFALESGLRSPVSSSASPRAIPANPSADPAGDGLGDRARRLRVYLASPPSAGPARRNPFSFPARVAAAPAAATQGLAQQAPAPEPRPEIVLAGIAEDGDNGGTVRTAVISAAGQLMLVKEGDRVLSRFAIVRIASDAVQIRDTERGDVFTLAFK
jgi:hypothetical protein